MINKIENLMIMIGILGLAAFANLFWICWFSPEMAFPLYAIRAIWVPCSPFFIIFILISYFGFKLKSTLLRFAIWFVPILFINGLVGLAGIKIIFEHSFSMFIFKPCLLGFIQIILTILIIICWQYKLKESF